MVQKTAYLLGAIIYMVIALVTLLPLGIAIFLWDCIGSDIYGTDIVLWIIFVIMCVCAYTSTKVAGWAMTISIKKFIRIFK